MHLRTKITTHRTTFSALYVIFSLIIGTSLALLPSHASQAKEHNDNPSSAQENNASTASAAKAPVEKTSLTQHKIKINGKTISYKVLAGDTHISVGKDNNQASIFSMAYLREDVKSGESQRPLVFVFNGGPGSSSVWLHMGLFGPKRVAVPSDAQQAGAPPFPIVDNHEALLDIADFVFIDPVGTGFSRPLGETKGKAFWGVKEDAEALAEFIRVFITKHGRWQSPKYLAGESYGTTRAAAITRELQGGWGRINLAGVLLISSILDFQAGDFTPGNDLPFVTFLPTYAATAWYHDALPDKGQFANLESFLQQVRTFALTEYNTVLTLGALATAQQRQSVVDKLHQFTGLSKEYIERTDLRIDEFFFMKELLRDRGVAVGRLDSRYLGEEASDVTNQFEADPSGYGIDGAYTVAINDYLRNELKVQRDDEYHILSGEVFAGWNWLYGNSARSQGFIAMTPHLAKAMRQNSDFRIFVANGYYDLATPFFATEYSMNHHGIDHSRLVMHYYEAGHMMYVHEPSLTKLLKDIRTFITSSAQ